MGSIRLKHFEGSRSSIQKTAGVLTMSFSGDAGREGEQRLALSSLPVLSTGSHYCPGQLSCQGPQVFKSTLREFACPRFLRFKALGDCLVTFPFHRLSAKQGSGMPSWHTDFHQVVVFKWVSNIPGDTHGHT